MFFVDNAIHIKGGGLTVAEFGGKVVGVVLWSPATGPAWFDPQVSHWAELQELHVHPKFQNRGIGTRLVVAAIRQARKAGFRTMYLETEESNIAARRVYEKAGFRVHDRILRYKLGR